MTTTRRSGALLDAWVALLAVLLTGPMWVHSGYGLARDMVFTPRAALTPATLGMGTSLPRAVPVDGVVAAAEHVVDGAVVFRLALLGLLVVAGAGAHRWSGDLHVVARWVMATAAVWNPYVVERLALGQWALLCSYAALWWLVPLLGRILRGAGGWPVLVALLTLGSLTPTGGCLLLLVVLCCVAAERVTGRIGRRDRETVSRAAGVIGITVLWQLPWLLPSLLGASAAFSDPSAVQAFAARSEGPRGVLLTALGTGGVWTPFAVPGSQQGGYGFAVTAAALVALGVGGREVLRRTPGLPLAGGIALLLGLLAHVPGGAVLLERAVADVPGAGLLRDGQKWLAPYVLLVVVCAGVAVSRLVPRLRGAFEEARPAVLAGLTLLPVVLVPDAFRPVWQATDPVTYPADLREAVAMLSDGSTGAGDVVTVPWAAYRRFSWGNDLSAADPVVGWVDRGVVSSDDLVLPHGVILGEDRRAAAISRTLVQPRGTVARSLADQGVGWLLLYGAGRTRAPFPGLRSVLRGPHVSLFRVPGPRIDDRPTWRGAELVVGLVQLAWLIGGIAGLAAALVRRARRGRRSALPAC